VRARVEGGLQRGVVVVVGVVVVDVGAMVAFPKVSTWYEIDWYYVDIKKNCRRNCCCY
jgi:hypothetical protein